MADYGKEQEIEVVAIHGNGGGGFRFELCKQFFEPPVKFHAPTLPGFADTELPLSYKSMPDYAAFLNEFIAPLTRPVVLLGHGIGGSLALEFCREHAHKIDGLILQSPVGAKLRTRRFARVMSIPGLPTMAKHMIASPSMRSTWTRLFFKTPPPESYADRFFEEYGQCRAFSLMFELITPAWFESLTAIPDLPACILWGQEENILSSEQIDDFKKLLPNSSIEIVDGWDHFPMVDSPEEYTSRVSRIAIRLVANANREIIREEL